MAQQALPEKSTGNVPDAILNLGRKRELATPISTGLHKAKSSDSGTSCLSLSQGSHTPQSEPFAPRRGLLGRWFVDVFANDALTCQLASRRPDASVSLRHLRFSPGESSLDPLAGVKNESQLSCWKGSALPPP